LSEKEKPEAAEEYEVDKRLVLRELIKNYRVRADMLSRRADERLKRVLGMFDEEKSR
jgi:hypothetical protein